MPALKLDTWRPSECPVHGSVHSIWLDGHYGRWSAYHERTRYTCVRFDEAGQRRTHRFVLPLAPRHPTEHVPGSGEACPECRHEQDRHEGPHTPDSSTFTIPEIARLLVSVGEGRPLRDCAHELRDEAYRRHCAPNSRRARPTLEPRPGALPDVPLAQLPTRPIRPAIPPSDAPLPPRNSYNYSAPKLLRRVDASRSASIAMDYVDQYGPVILEAISPERWPVYVALSSVPLPPRKRRGHLPGGMAGRIAAGEIMVAADCELAGRGYPFHARFAGGRDKDSWVDFFRSLVGRPTWIVADHDEGLAEAVAEFWPDACLFVCEDHLRHQLRSAARADRIREERAERGPVFDEIRHALMDVGHWQELLEMVASLLPEHSAHLRRWIDDNEALVLSQLLFKRRVPRAPTGCAVLEPALADIHGKLIPRSGATRNLWRLNLRIALMCAHWSGLDREREYIAALGRHFAGPARQARARQSVARPDWASGRDFAGASSIDDFLAAAEERRLVAQQRRAHLARRPAVPHNWTARNAARLAVGLAPLPGDDRNAGSFLVASVNENENWLAEERIAPVPFQVAPTLRPPAGSRLRYTHSSSRSSSSGGVAARQRTARSTSVR
jgi:hypothetical protein